MKIEYRGSAYEFDFGDLTVAECEAIEKFTGGKGLGEWSNQLGAANTKALEAAWWVIRRQAGQDPGPITRRDEDFRPVTLNAAIADAERAQAEADAEALAAAAEPEPDPTRPVPGSPAPAVTTTIPAAAAGGPSLPG